MSYLPLTISKKILKSYHRLINLQPRKIRRTIRNLMFDIFRIKLHKKKKLNT